jgi:hypothetical protein
MLVESASCVSHTQLVPLFNQCQCTMQAPTPSNTEPPLHSAF